MRRERRKKLKAVGRDSGVGSAQGARYALAGAGEENRADCLPCVPNHSPRMIEEE